MDLAISVHYLFHPWMLMLPFCIGFGIDGSGSANDVSIFMEFLFKATQNELERIEVRKVNLVPNCGFSGGG